MGQPKEFEMPKGKILMGKGPIKRPEPVKPKPKGGIVDPKRKSMPDGEKKRALPMPKPKPGKPAPKGGKVFERKLEDTSQKGFGAMPKRNPRNPIGGAGSIKRKPVMPPKKGGR